MRPIDNENGRGRYPYAEGMRDRAAGVARKECPYERASEEKTEWLAGWDDGQALRDLAGENAK